MDVEVEKARLEQAEGGSGASTPAWDTEDDGAGDAERNSGGDTEGEDDPMEVANLRERRLLDVADAAGILPWAWRERPVLDSHERSARERGAKGEGYLRILRSMRLRDAASELAYYHDAGFSETSAESCVDGRRRQEEWLRAECEDLGIDMPEPAAAAEGGGGRPHRVRG